MIVNSTAEEIFDPSVKGAALKAAAAGNFDVLPMFDRAMETSSRERIRAIQLEKLIAQVAYTYENVAWYRDKVNEMGVRPRTSRRLKMFASFPSLIRTRCARRSPMGFSPSGSTRSSRCTRPRERRASRSSSATPSMTWPFGAIALRVLPVWQASFPGDRVQMAFGYGMFTGGFGLHYGCMKLGCTMIPAGSGNTERHIQMIEDYGTTVIIATPTYALHICEVGEKMGYDWAKSTLRVGLFGGEPCPPALKAEIESRMHIVCTDNYGLTEVMGPGVSGECLAERDMQHIAEDHFLWEVVDPATGEPVPEGEMGELVLTPLDKEGIPVLRYRTHDLTRVVTGEVQLRTHSRAHAEGPLPLRRHAYHPRHECVPEPGRGCARGHRGRHPSLPYRGRQ